MKGGNVMPKVALFKQDGSQSGGIELNEQVFGIEPNKHVLQEAYHMQRASLRQGTHAVKNRSEVRGGVVNHGNKKVQVMHDKVLPVHHNGLVEELYLAQHHAVIAINCLRRSV